MWPCVHWKEGWIDDDDRKDALDENYTKIVKLATENGKAVRFSIESLRILKSRASDGVKSVKLLGGKDIVVSMSKRISRVLNVCNFFRRHKSQKPKNFQI
mgnify:CR=1 FL=1